MSDSAQHNPLFTSEVIYQLPYHGQIETGRCYSNDESLSLDIYYPAQRRKKMPCVILVTGYPDPGYRARVGCEIKALPQFKSWSSLFAASGIVAITYNNKQPASDVFEVLGYLQAHQDELNIDADKIALWSCSANVPNALSLLSREHNIRGAVFAYGFMLDTEGSDTIAQAAKTYGFAYPSTTLNDIPADRPIYLARAGKDEFAGLTASIDKFVVDAIGLNMAITVCNYPDGVHAFDILDKSAASKRVVTSMLAFVRGLVS